MEDSRDEMDIGPPDRWVVRHGQAWQPPRVNRLHGAIQAGALIAVTLILVVVTAELFRSLAANSFSALAPSA